MDGYGYSGPSHGVRKSRWGDYEEKKKGKWGESAPRMPIPGFPTMMPDGMDKEVSDAFMIRLKLDDLSRKLVIGGIGLEDEGRRSPSPEPIYDATGKRLNTREQRVKEKIMNERQAVIEAALRHNKAFRPPPDYAPLHQKKHRKVFINTENNPEYNFIGLIIGPRGNTQKRLERETNCKISIRGKGAAKEGKHKPPDPSDNEPLHVLITGERTEDVDKAKKIIEDLIRPVDDDHNEHKKQQLRELALINGTLRDNELCRHCGAAGHKIWNCPERAAQNWKPANVICAICGDGSHPTSDCPQKNGPVQVTSSHTGGMPGGVQMDSEYENFMNELQGKPRVPQPPPMPQMPFMPGMPGMSGMPGMPQMPQMPGMPQMPQMPGMPPMPGMMPGMPGMPGFPFPMPGMPGMMPGMPGMPGMPQGMPGMPQMPPGMPPMPPSGPYGQPPQPPQQQQQQYNPYGGVAAPAPSMPQPNAATNMEDEYESFLRETGQK